MNIPVRERGAALLTVLILVGIMGAIAVAVFDRLRLATMLAGNSISLDAARNLGLVGETLVTARIDDLVQASPGRTTLAGGWQGVPTNLPIPDGSARAVVVDGGNCFNLNSLVSGDVQSTLVTRPVGVEQFTRLMQLLGVPQVRAEGIAAAAADWIDTDDATNRNGAEDNVYLRGAVPYRTANTLMAEPSELRAVTGVSAEIYTRLRPWICALPVAEMSPINVNTVTPNQAPLIAMMLPQTIDADKARRAIAERPAAGWASVDDFWATPTLSNDAPGAAVRQPQVRTQWFALDLRVDVGDKQFDETALVDARRVPARIVARRWTGEE